MKRKINPALVRLRSLFARLAAIRYEFNEQAEEHKDARDLLVECDHFLAGVCTSLLDGKPGQIDQETRIGLRAPILDAAGFAQTLDRPPRSLNLNQWPHFLEIARLEEDIRLECLSLLGIKPDA